jgi:hypothetical protein
LRLLLLLLRWWLLLLLGVAGWTGRLLGIELLGRISSWLLLSVYGRRRHGTMRPSMGRRRGTELLARRSISVGWGTAELVWVLHLRIVLLAGSQRGLRSVGVWRRGERGGV